MTLKRCTSATSACPLPLRPTALHELIEQLKYCDRVEVSARPVVEQPTTVDCNNYSNKFRWRHSEPAGGECMHAVRRRHEEDEHEVHWQPSHQATSPGCGRC
ncbi:hypothetical protein AWZ03_010340 [Drosophila navojoa]|uniref:Uncharacterized protein n=1 Tax=Drosophila navojoa TaxID=7232 RepID=A0A484B350_DRONA|nr:hypothetical protein AWZ03_010340 [Drosophila navojoa]